MKQTLTKLGGALFVLLFLVTSSAKATITATWDWTTNNPTGIQTTPQISSTIATILSSNGVALTVDATASGATLRSQEGSAQFNEKTKLYVPVVSTKDKVTFTPNGWGYGGVKIGEDDFDNTAVPREHTATADEVAQGYVVIESKGGYVNTVSVELAYMPTASPYTTIIWDWKNGIPSGITSATQFDGASGTVVGSDFNTELTIVSGKFTTYGSNTNVQFNNGTIIRVPVTSTSDYIKITQYSNNNPKVYSLLFGTEETNVTTEVAEYQATVADVAIGYVQIKQGISNGYLYTLTLQKKNFTTATIGSTGWATFSNTAATDFTNLDGVVDAYEVTGNSGSAITKNAVTTVAANTGLLLNAAAGTYAIPLVASGTDLSATNKLKAVLTGETVSAAAGNFTNFVLAGGSGTASFKKITGANSATVGAGKAYLQLAGSSFAPQLFFDGDVTGIGAVKSINKEDGAYYNLAGQRVAQPQKGLYIVNGKKVIIK